MSVSTLYGVITKACSKIQSLKDKESTNSYSRSPHKGCDCAAELLGQIHQVYRAPRDIANEKHLAHLKLQASKSGISDE